jgi:DNA-binding CsgD family transcriptional regulator
MPVTTMDLIDYNPIIESLYDGVLSPDGFQAALRALKSAFRARQAALTVFKPVDLVSIVATAETTPELVADYVAHYHGCDPGLGSVDGVSTGEWWIDTREVGLTGMRTSAFYQEFFRHHDLASYMASPILRTPDREVALALQRGLGDGVFSVEDTRPMAPLVPHFQRALTLRDRMSTLTNAAELTARVLEHLQFGVAVIDARLRVLQSNVLGEHWLRRLGPKSRWMYRSAGLTRPFGQMVQAACKTHDPIPAQAATLATMDRGPCQVIILPLAASHRFAISFQIPAALVVFRDLWRTPRVLTSVLRDLYGLSEAELRVSMAIVDGSGVNRVSEKLRVSRETIRSQLKSVFSKTRTNTQAQLVHLLTLLGDVDGGTN